MQKRILFCRFPIQKETSVRKIEQAFRTCLHDMPPGSFLPLETVESPAVRIWQKQAGNTDTPYDTVCLSAEGDGGERFVCPEMQAAFLYESNKRLLTLWGTEGKTFHKLLRALSAWAASDAELRETGFVREESIKPGKLPCILVPLKAELDADPGFLAEQLYGIAQVCCIVPGHSLFSVPDQPDIYMPERLSVLTQSSKDIQITAVTGSDPDQPGKTVLDDLLSANQTKACQAMPSLSDFMMRTAAACTEEAESACAQNEKARQQTEEALEQSLVDTDHLKDEIRLLRSRVDVLESRLTAAEGKGSGIPLLYEGKKEKDLFDKEALDVVLEVLAEAYDRAKEDGRRQHILKDILDTNAGRGNGILQNRRDQMRETLKGYRGMTDPIRKQLQEIGFTFIEKAGKHYKMIYGDDPRYVCTLACTPSDTRSGENSAAAFCRRLM